MQKIFLPSNYEDYLQLKQNILNSIIADFNKRKEDIIFVFNSSNIEMKLCHFYINLIFWEPLFKFNLPLKEEFINKDWSEINVKKIASTLDNIILYTYKLVNQKDLNYTLASIIRELSSISVHFNHKIGNTFSIYDKIQLTNRNEEYKEIINTKFKDTDQTYDIEKTLKEKTDRLYEILKTEPNCLIDCFKAGDGINRNQLTQFEINIGPKPNLTGQVFPKIINTNYLKGLEKVSDYYIDASGGRKAAIINYKSVKQAGYTTRKLSLLCMNTMLSEEVKDCKTPVLLKIKITNQKILEMLHGRYVKTKNGLLLINKNKHTSLIGKTVKLRSPITCASKDGKICHKCYGSLSFINSNIHIGILGITFLTSQLQQMLLSAKHLLKTSSEKIEFPDQFNEYFRIVRTNIFVNPDLETEFLLKIENFDIKENEDDDFDNEDSSDVEGSRQLLKTTSKILILKQRRGNPPLIIADFNLEKELIFTPFLEDIIKHRSIENDDGSIEIPFKNLSIEEPIFSIEVDNNELAQHLNSILALIEKKDINNCVDYEDLSQKFLDLISVSNITVNAVHLENIIRELIRDPLNIIERPDFKNGKKDHIILRVSDAIMNCKYLSSSLAFEKLKKQFMEPNTYKKNEIGLLDSIF